MQVPKMMSNFHYKIHIIITVFFLVNPAIGYNFSLTFNTRKNKSYIITVRNSSCGKVMFSQASVSHSVHREDVRGYVVGACMAGGRHAWW